ncbi:glutathione synthase [Acuticoccus yangtzensis]|uniref:glutathione synthase n=1 Tax=Acuticoccus yangtzensis TaxID=1443441 RepID=UPI0009499D30|nr:glutathione synthase [Acuticoccus yangtzensis]ORE93647.1 glutathione synthetase [Stappia sp. 22II-S9-Z10]
MAKVLVQMDPIAGINIAGDSTFALLLEASRRGHELFHTTPDRLSFRGGKVTAGVETLTVRDERGNHATLGEKVATPLDEMDVILLRQDPPFDLAYITSTHFLESVDALVVNDPAGVRNAPEKIMVLEFTDLMPETLITRSREEIDAFLKEFGEIVIKPLYGHGGGAVFKVGPNDPNLSSLHEMFSLTYREPFVVQRFLPRVSEGDKRIILIDGEFAGAVNRVPQAGQIRSNMVRGGAAAATDLSPREREICERVGPALRERGLLFTGIDVIDGMLTEINVTSPTGIRAVEKLGGPNVAAMYWDAVEAKL